MASNRRSETKSFEDVRRLSSLADRFGSLLEVVEPRRSFEELVLTEENHEILGRFIEEQRYAETLRRHALGVRSKLLFCGPPGCGKTITAEVLARTIALSLFVVRLDAVIASFLGETASNLRKVFEIANSQSCVLFLDEFDAVARARTDDSEHSELRRVVNSLLMLIDRFHGRGLLIAPSNLERAWISLSGEGLMRWCCLTSRRITRSCNCSI